MASVWALSVLFVVNIMVPEEVTADPCVGAGQNISGASSGFLSSPNFPGNFLPSKTCVWIITVPSGRIKLSFLNFTLAPGVYTECSGAAVAPFVRLTNAASDDDNNPNFQLCGDKIPAPVYSVGNTIQIELISASRVYSGFNASYETVTDDMLCPNASQLTAMSGVITSPYYPRKYPNNQNCFWEITASKGNRVKLEVTKMEIHRCGQSGACTCDYLEILDGYLVRNDQMGGAASGKVCIDTSFTPQTYYSTNERLRVRFFSDPPAAKNFRGFTASYTQLNYAPPECPSAPIQLSGNGSFSSPNYPKSNYPSARNCFWIITASAGKRVKVTIKDFHMGWCDNCNAHYCSRVEFFDGPTAGSSSLGRFCTNSNLKSKVSSQQQMFVKFYSSFSPDRGFQAKYSETTDQPSPSVPADPCEGAGETVSGASSGFVSSPNFPGNFIPSKTCVWIITVPSGRIKLSFLNFTLAPGVNTECSGAAVAPFVRLTNAASDDDNNPNFQLCGDKIPAPVYSVGNTIQIELISASRVYSGFNASYETVTDDMLCPNASQLTAMSGVITSPYYPRKYPNNQNCFWEITASKGNRVKLEVTKMEIHRCGQSGACTCDYLEILDGYLVRNDQKGGAASGKVCIDTSFTPQTYYSTNERLRVRFFSDPPAAKNFRGFTASYTQLNYAPPECPSAPIQLSGNGSFSSPNYPKSNYPSARNCFWIITASAGKRVKVIIKDFQMGWCDNCTAHYCSRVEFFDGPTADSSSLGRFCTNSNLKSKVSSQQQMFVKFYSSFSPDRGFRAEYSETTDQPSPSVPSSPRTSTTSPLETTAITPNKGPDLFFVDPTSIGSTEVTVTLANKEFLSNGNRISYVQRIVTQLKENQQLDASTSEKYSAANVDKDYQNQVEGEPYITAEFDYGKMKTFRIGDGKYYSRSDPRKRRATGGPRKYFNGELNHDTNYAVFQRSFDSNGNYKSEDAIRFTTKKSFPTTIVVVSVVAGLLILVILVVIVVCAYRRFFKGQKANAIPMTDTGMDTGKQLIV